jgi:hypothetical protein
LPTASVADVKIHARPDSATRWPNTSAIDSGDA